MENLIIFGLLFIILFFADLLPLIRQKQWNYLFFSIPAYVIALALNIVIAS